MDHPHNEIGLSDAVAREPERSSRDPRSRGEPFGRRGRSRVALQPERCSFFYRGFV